MNRPAKGSRIRIVPGGTRHTVQRGASITRVGGELCHGRRRFPLPEIGHVVSELRKQRRVLAPLVPEQDLEMDALDDVGQDLSLVQSVGRRREQFLGQFTKKPSAASRAMTSSAFSWAALPSASVDASVTRCTSRRMVATRAAIVRSGQWPRRRNRGLRDACTETCPVRRLPPPWCE